MNSLNNYLFENLKINSDTKLNNKINVYSSKTDKELDIKWYCDNKHDWGKFESTYHQLIKYNLFKYSRMYLCEYKDNKWIANVNKNYEINDYQPNYRYFYSSQKNYYTYKELMEMLDSTKYLVIITNRK